MEHEALQNQNIYRYQIFFLKLTLGRKKICDRIQGSHLDIFEETVVFRHPELAS